jgi:hypothetical protein
VLCNAEGANLARGDGSSTDRDYAGLTAIAPPNVFHNDAHLAGPHLEPSRPDAPDENCHLLPALDVARDSLTAFAEVIEPCAVLIGGG